MSYLGGHNSHSVVQLFVVVIVLAVDMWEGYFDASVAVADDAAENIVAAEMVLFAFAVAFVDNCVAAAAAEFDVVAIYPDAVAAEFAAP